MSATDLLTCEETFRRLDLYLDRALSHEEKRQVEAHLETCAACAAEYRFESTWLEEVRSKLQRIEATPTLRERIAASLAGVADAPRE